MMPSERAALFAVWNASQTGDPRSFNVKLEVLWRLGYAGLLHGWKTEDGRIFCKLSAAGKWAIGVLDRRVGE